MQQQTRSDVFFSKSGGVGENLGRRRTFGEAGEHSLQRDARTLQDGFAADDLRIPHDAVLVVQGPDHFSATGGVVDGRPWLAKPAH